MNSKWRRLVDHQTCTGRKIRAVKFVSIGIQSLQASYAHLSAINEEKKPSGLGEPEVIAFSTCPLGVSPPPTVSVEACAGSLDGPASAGAAEGFDIGLPNISGSSQSLVGRQTNFRPTATINAGFDDQFNPNSGSMYDLTF